MGGDDGQRGRSVVDLVGAQMLRRVAFRPGDQVAALARDLGRDYRRVHDDVALLIGAGLIGRTAEGPHADYDSIQTTIAM